MSFKLYELHLSINPKEKKKRRGIRGRNGGGGWRGADKEGKKMEEAEEIGRGRGEEMQERGKRRS